jgi:hypothetical protein
MSLPSSGDVAATECPFVDLLEQHLLAGERFPKFGSFRIQALPGLHGCAQLIELAFALGDRLRDGSAIAIGPRVGGHAVK